MAENLTKWWAPISQKPTPEELALHTRLLFNGINDHDQAITALKSQLNTTQAQLTSVTNTVTAAIGTGVTSFNTLTGAVTYFPYLGTVNDQTGITAYTLQDTDNGILLIFNDASAVTASLNPAITAPFFCFVVNFGAGQVTLLPTSPSLINGYASLEILQNFVQVLVFDGVNWSTSSPWPKHVAFGNQSILQSNSVLTAVETPPDLNISGLTFNGINVEIDINNPTDTTVLANAIVGYSIVQSGNTSNYRDLTGGYFGCVHRGSGNFSLDFVGMGCEVSNEGGGTILYMTGVDPYLDNILGTATHMTAYKTSMHNEATVTNLRALWPHFEFSNTGNITNKYGIDIEDLNGGASTGTITNNYGINIKDQASGTNNWAIKTALGAVEIGDNTTLHKHLATGANASIDAVPATIIFGGASSTKVIAEFNESSTAPAGQNGLYIEQQFTPSGAVTSSFANLISRLQIHGSNNVGIALGAFSEIDWLSTGTVSQLQSLFLGPSNSGLGTVTSLLGINCYAGNYDAGNVTDFCGLDVTYENDAGVTANVDMIRLESLAIGGGSITTATGLRIKAITGAGTNYQIYSEGTSLSYLAGPIKLDGGRYEAYVAKTANYTIGNLDYQIECTANSFTVTLPDAVTYAKRVFSIKNTGPGVITVNTTSSQTIDSSLTQALNQWDNMQVLSNGANWLII